MHVGEGVGGGGVGRKYSDQFGLDCVSSHPLPALEITEIPFHTLAARIHTCIHTPSISPSTSQGLTRGNAAAWPYFPSRGCRSMKKKPTVSPSTPVNTHKVLTLCDASKTTWHTQRPVSGSKRARWEMIHEQGNSFTSHRSKPVFNSQTHRPCCPPRHTA